MAVRSLTAVLTIFAAQVFPKRNTKILVQQQNLQTWIIIYGVSRSIN
jgi:hypothetical protein